MPITEIQLPILSRFLCAVQMTTGMPAQPLDAAGEQQQRDSGEEQKKALPKGVVLGPDGKPYVWFDRILYGRRPRLTTLSQMSFLHIRLFLDGNGPLSASVQGKQA